MSIRSLPFLTTVKNMDDGMDKFLMTTFIHVLCFSQVKLHLQMLVLNQLENIYVGPDQISQSRLLRIGDNVAHSHVIPLSVEGEVLSPGLPRCLTPGTRHHQSSAVAPEQPCSQHTGSSLLLILSLLFVIS